MNRIFDPNAGKKPTNVSINSDLLEKARRLNINLSATLEAALTDRLLDEQRRGWQTENAQAVQAYNEFIEANGVFSDGVRQF